MGHDAVVLNVGGTLFTSTWTTLLNHTEGGSFFSGLHAVQVTALEMRAWWDTIEGLASS
jgi:hypothetical protein